MRDYSQWGEQKHILEYFGEKKGVFLDIGAADGENNSNTRALAENGWSGVCVEPDPIAVAKLLALYRSNQNVQILNAAVVPDSPGIMPYFGLVGQRSSLKEDYKWGDCQRFYISAVAISGVRQRFGANFDFISIDAEGMEFELLCACLMNFPNAKMICVEEVQNADETESLPKRVLEVAGYTVLARTVDNTGAFSNWIAVK